MFNKFSEGTLNTRLSDLLYAQRSSVQATTLKTPAELLFGRPFRSDLDALKLPKESVDEGRKTKFSIGDAVFAKNFGKGADWVAGAVEKILNSTTYVVRLSTDSDIKWKRHVSQLFRREILPTTITGILPEKLKYSEFSSFPAVLGEENDTAQNPESPVALHSETDVQVPFCVTRSGRISRPPDRLDL